MAFLAHFMKAEDVRNLSDMQVEVLATQVKAQMLTEVLRNEQVKGAITEHLPKMLISSAFLTGFTRPPTT